MKCFAGFVCLIEKTKPNKNQISSTDIWKKKLNIKIWKDFWMKKSMIRTQFKVKKKYSKTYNKKTIRSLNNFYR